MEVRDYYLTVVEGAQRGVTPRPALWRCLQDGDVMSFVAAIWWLTSSKAVRVCKPHQALQHQLYLLCPISWALR